FFEFLSLRDKDAWAAACTSGRMPLGLAELTRAALETRDGPSLLAVAPDEPAADLATARTRGLRVSTPLDFERPVTLPDGRETAAVVTVHFLDDPGCVEAPIFSSQQHNPDAVWDPG